MDKPQQLRVIQLAVCEAHIAMPLVVRAYKTLWGQQYCARRRPLIAVLPHCSHRVFPCATPAEVRSQLPGDTDVVAFQCRNPVHRAHYELFTRALHAPNVRPGAVCLVHPTCGPTQVRGINAMCLPRAGN